jgi:lipopolysaccharide transport system ATP-binding protein
MRDIAIRVENLGKKYRIGERERYKALRDVLTQMMTAPFRRLTHRSSAPGDPQFLWALKDVSFEVKQGEVVGIIGRNGAGKSTLLKILSRVTEPTEGYAEIHGRIGSLLEVGTGFHPELTGRENVYLNGAILGMKKTEIKRKFDEIVSFAEVEKFIDTPVKRYSSGMYLRLAFAVAAHLEPEILLVDEVLAVGDAGFQKKCLGKMGEVARAGRTVFFVSHNMEAIQKLCQRCIWLDHGNIKLNDSADRTVSTYLQECYSGLMPYYKNKPSVESSGHQKACLLEAEVLDNEGTQCQHLRFGEPFTIRMVWQHASDIPAVSYAIRIYDERERFLCAANTLNTNLPIESRGIHQVLCKFDQNVLIPGEYHLTIGCYIRPHTNVHVVDPCLKLIILNVPYYPNANFNIVGNPAFAVQSSWKYG